MSEWRPIDTAPKDGKEIVALSNGDPWIVRWAQDRPDIDGRWRVKALLGRDPTTYLFATHWMPLPEPPNAG